MLANPELIKRAQNGDRDAFSSIIDAYYNRIYSYAMKSCGHPQDAEDIAQQVCIKLARTIGQFRFDSEFSTWLYQIVVHCSRDWYRAQKRHHNKNSIQTTEAICPPVEEQSIYLQQVLEFIAQMGEDYRDTVVLIFGEGMSHADAAQVLEVKESTISWRLHEIRKRLKQFASLENVQ